MEDILERAEQRRMVGVRLVRATYHRRSMAQYSKLGFDVRELLVTRQGSCAPGELPWTDGADRYRRRRGGLRRTLYADPRLRQDRRRCQRQPAWALPLVRRMGQPRAVEGLGNDYYWVPGAVQGLRSDVRQGPAAPTTTELRRFDIDTVATRTY
jgi:hypothetical protein